MLAIIPTAKIRRRQNRIVNELAGIAGDLIHPAKIRLQRRKTQSRNPRPIGMYAYYTPPMADGNHHAVEIWLQFESTSLPTKEFTTAFPYQSTPFAKAGQFAIRLSPNTLGLCSTCRNSRQRYTESKTEDSTHTRQS
jgi:hypothetical protein